MATNLYLASSENEDARFMHPLEYQIEGEIGDEFDYDDHYYFQLTENDLRDFKALNLSKGSYIISQKYYDEIGKYWAVVMYKKP